MPSDGLQQNLPTPSQTSIGTYAVPYHTHNGLDSPSLGGSGMKVATYDPAGIAQQLVGTTAAQIVSNKTLISGTQTASGSSGTTTFDLSKGNVFNFTFSGSSASDSVTFALSNPTVNQVFIISVTQNSGGSGTVTWFSTIRWAGGSGPTLTSTASKRDTMGFIVSGTNTYDGFVIGQDI